MWWLDDAQTLAATQAAYALAERAHAAAVELLAETHARGLARETGAPSTHQWSTATRRVRPGTAKQDVRLAELVWGP